MQISSHCFQNIRDHFSFKKCSFLVLFILAFTIAVVGIFAFTVFAIVKPQKPIFSLQRVALSSYRLSVDSSLKTLLISSVVALNINASNPNKVGIKYSPSRLHILTGGLPVGVIQVPGFYQPAYSSNVSVHARVLLQNVNVSQVLVGPSAAASPLHGIVRNNRIKNSLQIKIVGDIRVRVRVFHVTFPRSKVALDCDIDVDYDKLPPINQFFGKRDFNKHWISTATKFETLSEKCSLALYL